MSFFEDLNAVFEKKRREYDDNPPNDAKTPSGWGTPSQNNAALLGLATMALGTAFGPLAGMALTAGGKGLGFDIDSMNPMGKAATTFSALAGGKLGQINQEQSILNSPVPPNPFANAANGFGTVPLAASPFGAPSTEGSFGGTSLGGSGPGTSDFGFSTDGTASTGGFYRNGGKVEGPGTGTSDSVNARLSDGEYVISADVVRKVGRGHFDELQRRFHEPTGRPHRKGGFFDGGLFDLFTSGGGAGTSDLGLGNIGDAGISGSLFEAPSVMAPLPMNEGGWLDATSGAGSAGTMWPTLGGGGESMPDGVSPPNPYHPATYLDPQVLRNLGSSQLSKLLSPGGASGSLGFGSSLVRILAGLEGRKQAKRLQSQMQGQADQMSLPDPSELTKMPGYEAGLEAVRRSMAANGYLGSGNMMTALKEHGENAYNQFVTQRQQLARDKLLATGMQAGPVTGGMSSLALLSSGLGLLGG